MVYKHYSEYFRLQSGGGIITHTHTYKHILSLSLMLTLSFTSPSLKAKEPRLFYGTGIVIIPYICPILGAGHKKKRQLGSVLHPAHGL